MTEERRPSLRHRPPPPVLQLRPMLLAVLAPVQTMMTLSVDKCLLRIIDAHPATVVFPMAMEGELYLSLRKDLLARNPGDLSPSAAVDVFLRMRSWYVPGHRGYVRRKRQLRRPIMTFCVCRRPNDETTRLLLWSPGERALAQRMGWVDKTRLCGKHLMSGFPRRQME